MACSDPSVNWRGRSRRPRQCVRRRRRASFEARSEASRLLAAARDATAAAVGAERRRVVLAAVEDEAAEISRQGEERRGPRASKRWDQLRRRSSTLRWSTSCRPTARERGVNESARRHDEGPDRRRETAPRTVLGAPVPHGAARVDQRPRRAGTRARCGARRG